MIELTIEQACRLAIRKQRLHESIKPTKAGIKEVARSLRVIQIDPINAVDRTQNLVLWSRLGPYDRKHFESLQWKEKFFFPYWAHAASLVLTEDLPLHRWRMKSFLDHTSGKWQDLLSTWMKTNGSFSAYVLRELRKHGRLRSRDLKDRSVGPWPAGGYGTSVQNVARMLDLLWGLGKITIVGREGVERVWGLTDEWLPENAPKESLPQSKAVEVATQHSLRALGVATPQHIKAHYTRSSYPDLPNVVTGLIKRGLVHPAKVEGLPGKWLIHDDDVNALDELEEPTGTTFLSPFDNLIADRKRTELLWNFFYRIEIYTPKAKRKYGYYALPILHNDRLVGRLDSTTDRAEGVLRVRAIHFEPSVKADAAIGGGVSEALGRLADFVADGNVDIAPAAIPKAWRRVIH